MSSKQPGTAKPSRSDKKTEAASIRPEAADESVDVKDDLRRINGVTDEMEQALESASVNSYEDTEKPQPKTQQAKRRQFEGHWKKDWVELADFFVSFGYEVTKSGEKQLQTRVIHYEGEKEQQWKNVSKDQLVEWILNQAQPSLPADVEPQSLEPSLKETQPEDSKASSPTLLEITDLHVHESKAAAWGSSGLQKSKLRMECLLNLPLATRELTENRLPVVLETHLVNMQTNRSTIVSSETSQLLPGEYVYKISQSFPVPAMGRYQVYVTARLLPPGDAIVQVKGPVIRVEV
jgi:hypothetical protein